MHLKIEITKIFDVYRGNEKTERNIGVAVGDRWLIVFTTVLQKILKTFNHAIELIKVSNIW